MTDGLRSRTDERGRFVNPWDTGGRPGFRDFLRWRLQRLREPRPQAPVRLPVALPLPAMPRNSPGELHITWIGHATFLIQLGGVNVLTDPVWSRRASPLAWAGPARLVPPGLALDLLPPIDVVLLSHDHYDHLDDRTVRDLDRRFGKDLHWVAPLGHRQWLARRGIAAAIDLDWWDEASLDTPGGRIAIRALPAQHWSRRSPFSERSRLWASFALAHDHGATVFFCGDSAYFHGFRTMGEVLGPLDAVLLPIGAYEPRWFMKSAHMNPEEAVRAYQALGATGILGAMHWGTFHMTDEHPLEPPQRLRAAWSHAGLPPERLWVPAHGETRRVISR